jgi:hypothetical protein
MDRRRFRERGREDPRTAIAQRAFVPESGGRRDDDAGDVTRECDLRAVLPTGLRAPPRG